MFVSRILAAAAAAVLVATATVDAAVLCARRRADGTFSTSVKIREACRAGEVLLTPDAVGFCCSATTSSTTTTTAESCPTSTTLGRAYCGGNSSCELQPCFGGQDCGPDATGNCVCTGPFRCGFEGYCGGECAVGTCQQLPVPQGCPSIGCECR